MSVFGHLNPWRSLLAAAGIVTTVAFVWDIDKNPLPFISAWAGSAVLLGIELLNHRTFLTPTSIVRQSGFLRIHCREYPLREVRSVEFSYPCSARPSELVTSMSWVRVGHSPLLQSSSRRRMPSASWISRLRHHEGTAEQAD
jgi:hypothetical protein